MIDHASVYDAHDPALDARLRVLVMRHWPRGIKRERTDVWLKDAAPSRELLHAYNHEGLSWAEFEQRYRTEILDERGAVLDELRALERKHGTVVLLCHERQGNCHRKVLLDLLAGSG